MMVFVAHPVAGVHRVPAEWLDGFRPSGFREATPAEIIRWHIERDLEPPALSGETISPADEWSAPSSASSATSQSGPTSPTSPTSPSSPAGPLVDAAAPFGAAAA